MLAMLFIVVAPATKAEEGMWLLTTLESLNIEDMQKLGCKLTAEQIYSINESSIKDAIVIFGGGCTSEMVSDKGLLFTNHHCGYDEIQNHSTVENDYLTNGFWAMSMEEELPNPGLTAKFLRSVSDVTAAFDTVLFDTMSYEDRRDAIRSMSEKLEDEAIDGMHYKASVEKFFGGNQFLLFVYEVFTDVRLVGAPPSSIGKYGGDTDNWMWPRHTGDFAVFRVYSDSAGKPAEYSENNIPLKPKHHLPISLKGVQDGDFTMIMGFPGSTVRYITSFGLKQTTDIVNTNRIVIRKIRQDILSEAMQASDKVRIQYASKFSRSSNYYKYSIGQNRGVARLKVLDKKLEREAAFQKWAEADEERKKTYRSVLTDMEEAYSKRMPYINHIQYLSECFYRSVDALDLAEEFYFRHWL